MEGFPTASQTSLVWCSRNPLNNLGVIPGKLAIPPEADQPQAEASATRNPDVGAGLKPAPTSPAFAGMTVGRSLIYFANFGSRTLA